VEVSGVPPPGTKLPLPWADASVAVVYADEWLLGADKPAGMPTLPLAPDELGTLASALVARFPELSGLGFSPLEAGILYRLDNDTSGVVIAARSAPVFAALARAQDREEIEKTYLALVDGEPPASGEIAWPIAHDRADRTRVVVQAGGRTLAGARKAVTRFRVIARGGGKALVEARIRSGARHQIRAHLAALGHPVAGDVLYGGSEAPEKRHVLHALAVDLAHPASGRAIRIQADLPAVLRAWLGRLDRVV
jgi:23S rRNA pseudouridine1911/1915/1917 synthase